MKLKILSTQNAEKGSIDLPPQFLEVPRQDLVKRAVLTIQSNSRQKYGTNPDAGKRHSTRISKRRRDYRGCYGHGISRVPRKITSRRGTRMNWVGAEAPGTVGGRRAHPPKAEKNWKKKINDKERRKAIRSALSAVMLKDLVIKRGHKLPETYPFILDNEFESLTNINKENLDKIIKELILKHKTNLKGVGQPLRIALTGSRFGPGIYEIILSLNKDVIVKRLKK